MASRKNGGDVLILEDPKKLRKLAKLLLNNEESQMKNIRSEPERNKYLEDCNGAYEKMISLIDDVDKMYKEYHGKEGKETKANIAKDVVDYIKYFANMSMQNVRNCSLRLTCIKKIEAEYEILKNRLKNLDDKNLTDVHRLVEEVTISKQCMLEYACNCRSHSARALSKDYSTAIKQQGITFPNLIEREKNRLGYKDDFRNLKDVERLEVYNSIIQKAGRGKFPKLEEVTETIGVGISVIASAMTVWDIFTSEHQLEAEVGIALSKLSDYAAIAVKLVAQAAIRAEAGVLTVELVGFAAGYLAGLLFTSAVDWLVDYLFNSGGKMQAPAGLNDCKFYVAKMPDGMALALEISHDDDDQLK